VTPNTTNRDPRDTNISAAWPPDADVVTVRLCPSYIGPGDTITATVDDEHRLRRMIRRLNREARP